MNSTHYVLAEDSEAIPAAARAVTAGQLVVLPTDTLYGIGACAFNAQAVQDLLAAKQRGPEMPPPVLIAEPMMLRAIADDIPQPALALAKAFWPGALTLILKAQPKGALALGETGGTVAVRVPDHEATRALLRATGPLAVSSANLSGQPAATTVQQAQQQLGQRVAVYLDDGPSPGAVASTIVDFAATTTGRIVRLGALSLAQLQDIAPEVTLQEELRAEPVQESLGEEAKTLNEPHLAEPVEEPEA